MPRRLVGEGHRRGGDGATAGLPPPPVLVGEFRRALVLVERRQLGAELRDALQEAAVGDVFFRRPEEERQAEQVGVAAMSAEHASSVRAARHVPRKGIARNAAARCRASGQARHWPQPPSILRVPMLGAVQDVLASGGAAHAERRRDGQHRVDQRKKERERSLLSPLRLHAPRFGARNAAMGPELLWKATLRRRFQTAWEAAKHPSKDVLYRKHHV